MNLTRRILEGIHEVELEITPEFRKEPEGQLSITVVDDLLQAMGWEQLPPGPWSVTQEGLSVRRVWVRPDMEGVQIVAIHPQGADHADEVYAWRADWGKQEIAPHLKDVEDTAKFLTASHGLSQIGAMGKEKLPETTIEEIKEAMKSIGWKRKKSVSGGGQPYFDKTTYFYPGADELIEIAVGKNGEIMKAASGKPGGDVAMITPDMDEIVKRAKAIKSWVDR